MVTKFEKDNPVKGTPEVFVDNPLCPTNKEGFWATTLMPFIIQQRLSSENAALILIGHITELYNTGTTTIARAVTYTIAACTTNPTLNTLTTPIFLHRTAA